MFKKKSVEVGNYDGGSPNGVSYKSREFTVSIRPNGSKRVQFDCSDAVEPSLTKQSEKDACDINNIVRMHMRNGEDPARYPVLLSASVADFSEVGDYHSALNEVVAAQEAFYSLPAELRTRFDNDPGKLLDFINDDRNRDKAIEYGLIPKPEVTVPVDPVPASGSKKKSEEDDAE